MDEYADKHLKKKTAAEYRLRLIRINQAIGNIKLCELRTGHINAFYSNSLFLLLGEHRAWQDLQRDLCGDRWADRDGRVFTNLFGAPLHPDTLTSWFKSFTRKHKFPDVHFHSLRHTYASLMIADGTPLVIVSRRLGHSQVSTTANIYSHVIQSATKRLHRYPTGSLLPSYRRSL